LNVWEELLKSDILEIPSEERVFEAMLDYVSHLPEVRRFSHFFLIPQVFAKRSDY
jgi:hypothetical protein